MESVQASSSLWKGNPDHYASVTFELGYWECISDATTKMNFELNIYLVLLFFFKIFLNAFPIHSHITTYTYMPNNIDTNSLQTAINLQWNTFTHLNMINCNIEFTGLKMENYCKIENVVCLIKDCILWSFINV